MPRRRRSRGRPDLGGPVASSATWPGGVEALYGDADRDLGEEGDAERMRRAELVPPDGGDAFDPAEFAEFLEADDSPMPVDSGFKERLRVRLWNLVREHARVQLVPALPRSGDRVTRLPLPDPDPKRPR